MVTGILWEVLVSRTHVQPESLAQDMGDSGRTLHITRMQMAAISCYKQMGLAGQGGV